jgi:hypothetical protein
MDENGFDKTIRRGRNRSIMVCQLVTDDDDDDDGNDDDNDDCFKIIIHFHDIC